MATASKNRAITHLVFLISISFFSALLCQAADSITQGESLRGNQTLISENQYFELGFFSPRNSNLQYVGIWYYNIQEPSVIWVGNRGNPISESGGEIRIGEDGNFMVFDANNNTISLSNASITPSDSTRVTLTNAGDLVLSSRDDATKEYWSSFQDPTDTFLPGMRVLVNAEMGENRFFVSWKSENDPSVGNYTMGIDPRGSPQIVIWEGQRRRWRSGHWDQQKFTGVPNMTASLLYGFVLSSSDDDGNRFFGYTQLNNSEKLRFRIRWDGSEEQLRWIEGEQRWNVMQSEPATECELYNRCGAFGVCSDSNSPKCSCMQGFEPMNIEEWNMGNWSGGCVRKTQLLCQRNSSGVLLEEDNEEQDGFATVRCNKLPDFVDSVVVATMETCREICLSNCSCTAFADVTGIGCMIWRVDLVDVQHFSRGGSTLNIRLALSDLGGKRSISTAIIIVIVVLGAVFLPILIWLLWKFRAKLKVSHTRQSISCWKSSELPIIDMSRSREFSTEFSGPSDLGIEGHQVNGAELPLFSFNAMAIATDNFSEENKLGQGGFGHVYKGKLPGGNEVAVKRLSVKSRQGLEEFKNEIMLIAKLQHRNLVRLLGYCIQGEDKMLLYEYMPNKSLDCFLFDSAKQALLDWRTRFTIIEGIARGLLYLHRDSRLRIIHRDLKANNILLDEDMNPKISDFGMARIFGGNQDEANTIRVVGTYGYMAPEYAMEGLFSVKSDVYSFGVLLLEIVCGRRNTSFRLSEQLSLIGYAWHLWNEGKPLELLDPSIADTCSMDEVQRCIHVGMLCVQDSPIARPIMSNVVLMLESESTSLPLPRQPTYTSMRSSIDTEMFVEPHELVSSNDMTVTMVVGR